MFCTPEMTSPTPPPDFLRLKQIPLPVDERSDETLTQSLINPPPVTSEKNVWAFWDSGFSAMPPWQKRNVLGWVRQLGPSWAVRVLDLVDGSPAHVFNFLDGKDMHTHLVKPREKGRYTGAHTSDTIRLPAVFQHGGVWMDVGMVLLMHLDQVCWSAIENLKSKIEVALASGDPTGKSATAENFFIAARKGNGYIKRWMLIQHEIWKDRTDHKGIHKHPLFRHLIRADGMTHVFNGASGDKLDYFQAYLAYERLRLLEDPNDGFSGPNYSRNRVLLIDYREFASAAMLTNDDGPTQFRYFCQRYDAEGEKEREYEDARLFTETLLNESAFLKLYHWRDHNVATLADLWDKRENHDADCTPGTFGWYLRYAVARFTQDRKIRTLKFPRVREKTLVAGLLEMPKE